MMNEKSQTFIHQGSEPAEKPFHYTQCGLDDVFLLSGFTEEETAYGPVFSIKNIEGLHEAIAFKLVRDRKTFTDKEVRFLRKHMGRTQKEFGDIIGVSDQMVARFEKGESKISPASAMLLRLRVITDELPDDETLKEVKSIVGEIEAKLRSLASDKNPEPIYLKTVKGTEWKVTDKVAA